MNYKVLMHKFNNVNHITTICIIVHVRYNHNKKNRIMKEYFFKFLFYEGEKPC